MSWQPLLQGAGKDRARATVEGILEFHADANLRHQLGARFRTERRSLEALLDLAPGAESALAPGLEVLRRRSERLAPVMAELRACARSGRLSVPPVELAPSYLYM